jgi:hypothetical protein
MANQLRSGEQKLAGRDMAPFTTHRPDAGTCALSGRVLAKTFARRSILKQNLMVPADLRTHISFTRITKNRDFRNSGCTMREEFASNSFLAVTVAGLVLLCSGLLAIAFG